MERDFYRDEFEQLLKDSTEDFKMYPSRKVWHSIYNDLHPDRKWPSFAVCLLLLTAILYVGVSNNNSINSAVRKQNVAFALQSDQKASEKQNNISITSVANNKPQGSRNYSPFLVADDVAVQEVAPIASPISAEKFSNEAPESTDIVALDEVVPERPKKSFVSAVDGKLSLVVTPGETLLNTTPKVAEEIITAKTTATELAPELFLAPAVAEELTSASLAGTMATNSVKVKDTREREFMEHDVFYNKPKKKKHPFAGLDAEFYISPGVGYRVMFQNNDYKEINNSLVAANSATRYDEPRPLELNQQVGLTMEMGGTLSKKLGKRFNLKTGLQLNISDYITYAKKLDHPGTTLIALTDVNTNRINFEPRLTNYANVPGENNSQLHNKTIQFSIPVGVDYRLLSAGRINWHLGASVQPSYVAGGYAYLVSADNNYFIEDESMLRRWNVNAALESFISIKTPEGGRINLGPQFRYSLLSIYKNSYSYTEKPYNFGFKIGFSKSF